MCCFDIYKMPELAAVHNQPHGILAKTAFQKSLWRRREGKKQEKKLPVEDLQTRLLKD